MNKELKNEIMSLEVGSLPDYIDNKGELIDNMIAGSGILSEITPQTGDKAGTIVPLNILDLDVNFQAGDCVNSATGSTIITQRFFKPQRFTDRQEICLDKLDRVLPMLQSSCARNEELPFINQWSDVKVNKIQDELDNVAWMSDSVSGSGNLSITDGWVTIAKSETGDLAHYATYSAQDFIDDPLKVIDEGIMINRTNDMFKRGGEINLSLKEFAILANAIYKLYGYNATGDSLNNGQVDQKGDITMRYPNDGNVLIKGRPGLDEGNIFYTDIENLKYDTDCENDTEDVDYFFDKVSKKFISDIVFTIGFQYLSPNRVIYLERV